MEKKKLAWLGEIALQYYLGRLVGSEMAMSRAREWSEVYPWLLEKMKEIDEKLLDQLQRTGLLTAEW